LLESSASTTDAVDTGVLTVVTASLTASMRSTRRASSRDRASSGRTTNAQ
jgi:hypothetical protein